MYVHCLFVDRLLWLDVCLPYSENIFFIWEPLMKGWGYGELRMWNSLSEYGCVVDLCTCCLVLVLDIYTGKNILLPFRVRSCLYLQTRFYEKTTLDSFNQSDLLPCCSRSLVSQAAARSEHCAWLREAKTTFILAAIFYSNTTLAHPSGEMGNYMFRDDSATWVHYVSVLLQRLWYFDIFLDRLTIHTKVLPDWGPNP